MRSSGYASKKVIVLAVFQIILGCFAISLGIPSAVPTQASYPYGNLGYGIWSGVVYIISGIIGIMAGAKRSADLIVWHLVLSIMSAILATLQFSLGIAAASQDYSILQLRYWESRFNETQNPSDLDYYRDLKKFYSAYFPMTEMLAASNNRLTAWLHRGVVAVDSLLACGGILMMIVSALSAASGCRVTCCSHFDEEYDVSSVAVTHHPGSHAQTGYHVGQGRHGEGKGENIILP